MQCRVPSETPIPIDQLADALDTLSSEEQAGLVEAFEAWDAASGDAENDGSLSPSEVDAFIESDEFSNYVEQFHLDTAAGRRSLVTGILSQFGIAPSVQAKENWEGEALKEEVAALRREYADIQKAYRALCHAAEIPPLMQTNMTQFEVNMTRFLSQIEQALKQNNTAAGKKIMGRLRQASDAYVRYLIDCLKKSGSDDRRIEVLEQAFLNLVGDKRDNAVALGGGIAVVGGALAAGIGLTAAMLSLIEEGLLLSGAIATTGVTGLFAYAHAKELPAPYPFFRAPEVEVSLYRNNALQKSLPTTAALQQQALDYINTWLSLPEAERATMASSIDWGSFMTDVAVRREANRNPYASLSLPEKDDLSEKMHWQYRLQREWLHHRDAECAAAASSAELTYIPGEARSAWDRNRDGTIDQHDKARGAVLLAMAPYLSYYAKKERWLSGYSQTGKGNCTSRMALSLVGNRYAPWPAPYEDGIQVYDTHVQAMTYDPTRRVAIDSIFGDIESPIKSTVWSPIYMAYAYLWTTGWRPEQIAAYLGMPSDDLITAMKRYDTGAPVQLKAKPADDVIDFPFWQGQYSVPEKDESYDPIAKVLRPDLERLSKDASNVIIGENFVAWKTGDNRYGFIYNDPQKGKEEKFTRLGSTIVDFEFAVTNDLFQDFIADVKKFSFEDSLNRFFLNINKVFSTEGYRVVSWAKGDHLKSGDALLRWDAQNFSRDIKVLNRFKKINLHLPSMEIISTLSAALEEAQTCSSIDRFIQAIDALPWSQKGDFLDAYLSTPKGQQNLAEFWRTHDLVAVFDAATGSIRLPPLHANTPSGKPIPKKSNEISTSTKSASVASLAPLSASMLRKVYLNPDTVAILEVAITFVHPQFLKSADSDRLRFDADHLHRWQQLTRDVSKDEWRMFFGNSFYYKAWYFILRWEYSRKLRGSGISETEVTETDKAIYEDVAEDFIRQGNDFWELKLAERPRDLSDSARLWTDYFASLDQN